MSDPSAPVCIIEPVISHDQPPSVLFPSIPLATDLKSALAAINAMAHTIRILTGQMDHAFQGPPGRAGAAGKSAPKGGRFQEVKPRRIVNKIKIASKEDPSTTLTFKRIDSLTFKDTKTGELWQWTR